MPHAQIKVYDFTFFMFYNIYSTIHFAIQNNYTTFAGVNSKDMKKKMLLLALCAMLVGCESEFGEYPIAGKSYKTAADEDGDYIIYKFASSGKLYTDYYYDGEYEFGVVDYWWMEGDSIFAESGKEREDKIKEGCYHGNYIRMNWKNAYLITR